MHTISDLTYRELNRQQHTLNLISSENYPSPAVLDLLGSVWSTKYGEGYPGKRYYAGNTYTDELETYVKQLALNVFDKAGEYDVNVQVLSGSPANAMVYLATLNYGDTILSLDLAKGGHLSHLHQTSSYAQFFKHVTYDVKQTQEDTYEIDLDDLQSKILHHSPKLIIIGFSSYPRAYSFGKICQLAHEHGVMVLADIAHINGLVAAGLHDSPFKSGVEGADFVTMTTHKTLRGPRGALLFAKKKYIDIINRTIFPGTSGGPHFHQIAAIGRCLEEIIGTESYPDNQTFDVYSKNVIDTCKSLEDGLKDSGLSIISPTQTHQCLIRLPEYVGSLDVQKSLESIGIITNRNMIPYDTKTAWRPSGMRFGTAALASRGLTIAQAFNLGKNMGAFILDASKKQALQSESQKLLSELTWWYS